MPVDSFVFHHDRENCLNLMFHVLTFWIMFYGEMLRQNKGSFIYYLRKTFRKLTFLTPWYAQVRVRVKG